MTKLENQLDVLDATLMKMYHKVYEMHEKCEGLFEDFDVEIALSIIEDDSYVNNLDIEINDQAVYAVALMQPVARDLRRIIAAFKMATELERIGDYAKNIAGIMIKTERAYIEDKEVCDYFLKMSIQFKKMLAASFSAFVNHDVDLAFEIGKEDRNIDKLVNEMMAALNEHNDIPFAKSVFIMKVLRNMERSGDHTLNICEHIIYLNKGQHYEFG
ncbi:MAG: phosphate signaling complex protein PhoU [Erysipelotrichaceae bacterium]